MIGAASPRDLVAPLVEKCNILCRLLDPSPGRVLLYGVQDGRGGGNRVQRVNQRQGFLLSAIVHLTLLMIVLAQPPSTRAPEDLSELERREVVFLPPAEVLRQLFPAPAAPARSRPAVPTPPPQSQDPTKKDRISIGPPSELRSTGPLILRREDDLTKVPKGQPEPPPRPAPTPVAPTPGPAVAQRGGETPETRGREGLRLPPGLLGPSPPHGDEGTRRRPEASARPSTERWTRWRADPGTRAWGCPQGPERTSTGSASTLRGRTSPCG